MTVDLWFWRADPTAARAFDALRAELAGAEVAPDPARPGGYQGFRLRGAPPAGLVPFEPITALLALDGQVGPGEPSPVVQLVASTPGVVCGTVAGARDQVAGRIAALTGAGFTVLDHATGVLRSPPTR